MVLLEENSEGQGTERETSRKVYRLPAAFELPESFPSVHGKQKEQKITSWVGPGRARSYMTPKCEPKPKKNIKIGKLSNNPTFYFLSTQDQVKKAEWKEQNRRKNKVPLVYSGKNTPRNQKGQKFHWKKAGKR